MLATFRVHGSRNRRRALPCAVALAGGLAVFGCTSTITPPPAPSDPVQVFFVQDDRHLGLFLPRSQGVFVEYGYGDWDWYALMYDRWYHVFDTVLWPTQGTLARREVLATDGAGLRRWFPWMEVLSIAVSGEAARSLLADLDAQYAAHADEQHYNPVYGMTFVPHDDGYWFLYNCNDAVAGWLRALDCSVSWVPIRLGLALAGQ